LTLGAARFLDGFLLRHGWSPLQRNLFRQQARSTNDAGR
jgi:hypothetical protein